MKHTLFLILTLCLLVSCGTKNNCNAVFDYFSYTGQDAVYEPNIDEHCQYRNPILSGFYPDPSFCRKDSDYFLVTSSFSYYPGIPIFHSRDLVNWVQTGNVLNRPSQLALRHGIRLSGGVYAPVIRYNSHNDTFYLINTVTDAIGNFIVKTKNPLENNWSEPIPLKFGGIDPDLFFDDDGKGYIVHNDAPAGKPEWEGHRAIWLRQFSVSGDSIFGEPLMIVDGGTDKTKHPIWIEAPHLYKINGYYYLMCAEGGTAEAHSEVIFRAENVFGPYIPWKNNPILTQRDLPENRENPITSAGHADLLQTPAGDWYAVFLACRPYAENHYNTGRETFMLPVKWTDGFPVILPKGEAIPYIVTYRNCGQGAASETISNDVLKGNFTWRDEFDGAKLGDRWLMLRTPTDEWWKTANGALSLTSTESTIYKPNQPAFVGVRQQHLAFEAETKMNYLPENEGDIAGLVCYQKENHNIVFGKTIDENGKYFLTIIRAEVTNRLISNIEISKENTHKPLTLKVAGRGATYSFYYSFDEGKTLLTAAENVDATNLSTKTAGGFSGVIIGLYNYKNPFHAGKALSAWKTGAWETGKYRNVFAEMGYPQAEIDKKSDSIFNEIFFGENHVYFEVDDSTAYISDVKNHDARTEGMSYGMMIAVQFDRRDIFDKLWRWSVKYMQHKDGASRGYFAWSCKTDGTRNSQGAASDGELYYITSLIFASNRWGNDGAINYLKEAQYILDCAFAKDGTGEIRNFIDTAHKLITFVPDGAGSGWTDPSYHIPAFYEVWAKWANDGRADFWRQCADSARAYLHRSVHPVTALNSDQNNFDGSLMERKFPNGMVFRNDAFRFDSWRVPMNIALDYSWSGADHDWQQGYAEKFQNFLYLQGINTFVDQYAMDGGKVTWILPAGGKMKLRHSLGLVATSAAVSLASNHAKNREFVDALWNAKNLPFDDGYFDAYYDGLLQLFSFMHLSGKYRIIEP